MIIYNNGDIQYNIQYENNSGFVSIKRFDGGNLHETKRRSVLAYFL